MPKRPPKPEGIPSAPRIKQPPTAETVLKRYVTPFLESKKKGLPLANSKLSDTEIAISGSALIDDALRVSIISTFRVMPSASSITGLFEGTGASLSSMGAKIRLYSVLFVEGPEIKDDLDNVRKIRNGFAHSTHSKFFHDADMAQLCANFHARTDAFHSQSPRRRFIIACGKSVMTLISSVLFSIETNDLLTKNWTALSNKAAARVAAAYLDTGTIEIQSARESFLDQIIGKDDSFELAQ